MFCPTTTEPCVLGLLKNILFFIEPECLFPELTFGLLYILLNSAQDEGEPLPPSRAIFSMGTIKELPGGVVLVFAQHPSRAYWLSTECSLILLIDNSSQILTSLSPAKPVTTGLHGTSRSCSVTEQICLYFVQSLNMTSCWIGNEHEQPLIIDTSAKHHWWRNVSSNYPKPIRFMHHRTSKRTLRWRSPPHLFCIVYKYFVAFMIFSYFFLWKRNFLLCFVQKASLVKIAYYKRRN